MDQISVLKEQIINLQQNEKDYQDLNFLFTNLEHRYNLLAEEKQRMELEYNRRHEFNMQAVAMHRAEIDQLRNQLLQQDSNQEQMEYIIYENQALTEEVKSLRDAYTQIVQQIQEQEAKYQTTLAAKQQYIESLQFQIKQMNDIQQQRKFENNEVETYKSQNEKLSTDNKQLIKQIRNLEQQILNYKEQMTSEINKMQQHLTKELSKQFDDESKIKNQKCDHQQSQIEQLILNNQQLIIECDTLRVKLAEQENTKLLVQNQYAKSINKFQEERKVIKDYLCNDYTIIERQKVLRETRLQNENDVSKCLEEITRINK